MMTHFLSSATGSLFSATHFLSLKVLSQYKLTTGTIFSGSVKLTKLNNSGKYIIPCEQQLQIELAINSGDFWGLLCRVSTKKPFY
jgi:hypothetical protein